MELHKPLENTPPPLGGSHPNSRVGGPGVLGSYSIDTATEPRSAQNHANECCVKNYSTKTIRITVATRAAIMSYAPDTASEDY
jgi:hypothetical protein